MQKLDSLTGLRFIAALVVLILHGTQQLPSVPYTVWLTAQGGAGVTFFFVLSGFILTYTYGVAFNDGISRSGYRRFLRARFARIYPMHLAALLLVTPLALYWLTLPVPAETWDHFSMDSWVVGVSWLLSALTLNAYLPVSSMMDMWNPPSWSICDEMFFYVSFPLILVLVKRWFRPSLHGAAAIVVLLSVLSLASNAFMVGILQNVVPVQAAQTDLMFVGRFPILRLPEFVAGCLTCLLFQGMKQQGLYAWLGNRRVRDVCVGLSVVLLLGVAAAHAIRLPASLEMARSYLYEYAVWTLPFAFFILVIASGPTFLSPFLGSRWLVLLGEASYALYIFHWIVIRGFRIWEVTGHGISALAGWSLLGATIPVSVLLFKYVETPARVFLRGNSESRISDAPMTERNGTTSTGAAVAA